MRRNFAVAIAIVAAALGCTSQQKQVEPLPTVAGSKRVDWQGTSLGERVATLPPETFGQRVTALLRDRRLWSATSYVERYPDVATVVLRTPPVGLSAESLLFIEQVHERQTGGAGPYWEERRRAAAPLAMVLTTSPPHADRDKVIELCKATEGTAAAIDGYRLAAQTNLAADRSKEATAAVMAALSAASGRPYETAELWLVCAESLRRGGQAKQGEEAWARSAAVAASLLTRVPAVKDPHLWERLASLRQVRAAWPAEVHDALLMATQTAGFPAARELPVECLLWIGVGCWRLDRNETNGALTAFKRAETLATDSNTQAMLRVWQAKALVLLDQVPTATALVTPLADHPQPAVASAALATLAAIKLQAGAARQALGLFERADGIAGNWPWQAECKANLALALLEEGDEQRGLDQLRRAQDAFRALGDLAGLLLSYKNELEYWSSKGEKAKVEEVRKRIERIESTGTAS